MSVFCSLDYPNHTLVGGVSVHSLCQQGGLFALSVNRHSVLYSIGLFGSSRSMAFDLRGEELGYESREATFHKTIQTCI